MMRHRIATVRTMLIFLLALAVLGFRSPVAHPADPAQVTTIASNPHGHSHDHHGHSHDGEDQPSAPSGHDHDRFHLGDHSHDTPTAADVIGFRFAAPKDQGRATLGERIASRPNPPGDRPPRQA
jgi:hypothetical protein